MAVLHTYHFCDFLNTWPRLHEFNFSDIFPIHISLVDIGFVILSSLPAFMFLVQLHVSTPPAVTVRGDRVSVAVEGVLRADAVPSQGEGTYIPLKTGKNKRASVWPVLLSVYPLFGKTEKIVRLVVAQGV